MSRAYLDDRSKAVSSPEQTPCCKRERRKAGARGTRLFVFEGSTMRSELGLVRILSPRAPHAVASELRTHDLAVNAIARPAFTVAAPALRRVGSLPAYLLVRRPPRPS